MKNLLLMMANCKFGWQTMSHNHAARCCVEHYPRPAKRWAQRAERRRKVVTMTTATEERTEINMVWRDEHIDMLIDQANDVWSDIIGQHIAYATPDVGDGLTYTTDQLRDIQRRYQLYEGAIQDADWRGGDPIPDTVVDEVDDMLAAAGTHRCDVSVLDVLQAAIHEREIA